MDDNSDDPCTGFPPNGVTYTAASAVVSPCGRYRYSLSRVWSDDDANPPYVLFVMLNPSVADGSQDDPTLKKCVRFAHDRGYRALRVCNLFALRATDPGELRSAIKTLGVRHAIGPGCDGHLTDKASGAACVCVGWGAHGDRYPNRVGAVERILLEAHGRPILCLARTKSGQPQHPLMLKYGLAMDVYARPEGRE